MKKWEAFIMYDKVTSQRVGIYTSKEEAKEDCPDWKPVGYVIEPCEIVLVKKHKRAR